MSCRSLHWGPNKLRNRWSVIICNALATCAFCFSTKNAIFSRSNNLCKQHDTPIGTLPVLDGPKHKIGWKINIMKNFPRSVYHYPLLLVALCHYILFSVWLLVALFFSLFLLSDSGQLSGRLNLPSWQAKQLTMHKSNFEDWEDFAMETKFHDGGLDLLIFEAPLALRFGHLKWPSLYSLRHVQCLQRATPKRPFIPIALCNDFLAH